MRIHIPAIAISLVLISLFACGLAYGQTTVEYHIQIDGSGSAAWTIRQTGTNMQSFPDTLFGFRDKVLSLIATAQNRTQRTMAANEDEFSLASNSSGSYVIVEYTFYWQNFSEIENSSITIGDVFQVDNFFSQLYGDGKVYMAYPSQYTSESVSPPPSRRDDSVHILEWPGTLDFGQDVRITLKEKPVSSGIAETLGQNAVLIGSLAIIAVLSSVGVFALRKRKKKDDKKVDTPLSPVSLTLESDEDKVVKLLKSSGGSSYQSAITDHFRFSKAKTSQLLTLLEDKGVVRRYRKGRDKIVVLVEKDESEKK